MNVFIRFALFLAILSTIMLLFVETGTRERLLLYYSIGINVAIVTMGSFLLWRSRRD